jgi:glycogenin glucosyltransferase
MKAYITLLSTTDYLAGVIVLHDSVVRTKTSYPFWVALSSAIPLSVDGELKARGMKVIRLSEPVTIPAIFSENSGHWRNTFDKLQLFGLTDFIKLVYLDSDMIVMHNIDELFEQKHMSAVAAGQLEHPDWTRLNSGLMVIEPEEGLPEKIVSMMPSAVEEVTALGSDKIGDQDVVNAYYSDWPNRKDLHLDDAYNIFYTDLDAYIDKHGYQLAAAGESVSRPVRVLHYVGPLKPWMKWANAKHLISKLRKKSFSSWERRAFLLYLF